MLTLGIALLSLIAVRIGPRPVRRLGLEVLAWRPHPALATLALGALLLTLTRLALLFSGPHLVYGSDSGSYLITLKWLTGHAPWAIESEHWRPPLMGLLLLPSTWALGDLAGSRFVALMLSTLPGFTAYYLARQFNVSAWWAALAGLVLMLLPLTAQTTATNQITLPATALALWALVAMIQIGEGKGRIWHLAPPVFLLVGLNQTTAGVFAIMAVTMLVLARDRWRLVKALALATLAASAWAWFYWTAIPGGTQLYNPDALLLMALPSPRTILLWLPIFLLFLLRPRERAVGYLFVTGTVLMVLAHVALNNVPINNVLDRGIRVLSGLSAVAIALLAYHGWEYLHAHKSKAVQFATAGAAALILVGAGVLWHTTFNQWASTFNFVSADSLSALQWLKSETPKDTKVMAFPDALGWYVGGLGERNWVSYKGMGVARYVPEDKAFACAVGWTADCDPTALARNHGIEYLVIDRSSWQATLGNWDKLDYATWVREVRTWGQVSVYAFGKEDSDGAE